MKCGVKGETWAPEVAKWSFGEVWNMVMSPMSMSSRGLLVDNLNPKIKIIQREKDEREGGHSKMKWGCNL